MHVNLLLRKASLSLLLLLFCMAATLNAQITTPVMKTFETVFGPKEIPCSQIERKVFFSEFDFAHIDDSWGTGFEIMVSNSISPDDYVNLKISLLEQEEVTTANMAMTAMFTVSLQELIDESNAVPFVSADGYQIFWFPHTLSGDGTVTNWGWDAPPWPIGEVRGICIIESVADVAIVRDFVVFRQQSFPRYTLPTNLTGGAVVEYFSTVGNTINGAVSNGNFQLRDWGWDTPENISSPPGFDGWTNQSPGAPNSHFTVSEIIYSAEYKDMDIGENGFEVRYEWKNKDAQFSEYATNCSRDPYAINYKPDTELGCESLSYSLESLYSDIGTQLSNKNAAQTSCQHISNLANTRYGVSSTLDFYKSVNQGTALNSCFSNDVGHIVTYLDPKLPLGLSSTPTGGTGPKNITLGLDNHIYSDESVVEDYFFTVSHEIGHHIAKDHYSLPSSSLIQEGFADLLAISTYNYANGCQDEGCFEMYLRRYNHIGEVYMPFVPEIARPNADIHRSCKIIPKWMQLLAFGGLGQYGYKVLLPTASTASQRRSYENFFALRGIGMDRSVELVFEAFRLVNSELSVPNLYPGSYFMAPLEDTDLLDLQIATFQAADLIGLSTAEREQLELSWAAIGMPVNCSRPAEYACEITVDWPVKWRTYENEDNMTLTEVEVDRTIVIEAGGELDFTAWGTSESRVQFEEDAGIIVLPGGKLNLDNVRLQALSGTWKGVTFIDPDPVEFEQFKLAHEQTTIFDAPVTVNAVDSEQEWTCKNVYHSGIYQDVQMLSGDIRVGNCETLDLRGAVIEFVEGAGIIVEPCAKLLISESTQLVGACGVEWDGITVLGSGITGSTMQELNAESLISQSPEQLAGITLSQGLVRISEGAQIRNARVAIASPDEYHGDSETPEFPNASGGLILVDGTNGRVSFSENYMDIQVSASVIRGNPIIIDSADFLSSNSNAGKRMLFENVRGVTVQSCDFIASDNGTEPYSTAITANNSPGHFIANRFENFEFGINTKSPPLFWGEVLVFDPSIAEHAPMSTITESTLWEEHWIYGDQDFMQQETFASGIEALIRDTQILLEALEQDPDNQTLLQEAQQLFDYYDLATLIANRILAGMPAVSLVAENEFLSVKNGLYIDRGRNFQVEGNSFEIFGSSDRTVGVKMKSAMDVSLTGNSFRAVPGSADLFNHHCVGIESVFTSAVVGPDPSGLENQTLPLNHPDSNTFSDLRHGIDCYDGGNAVGLDVYGNNFSGVLKGITMLTNNMATIGYNNLDVPAGGTNDLDHAYGVSMDQSDGFVVTGNRFTTAVTSGANHRGILIYNCMDFPSNMTNNDFEGIFAEATTLGGDNTGLRLHCNRYYNSQIDWFLEDGLIMQDQGADPIITANVPAFRNQWHDPDAGGWHIFNASSTGVMPFRLFHDEDSAPQIDLCQGLVASDLINSDYSYTGSLDCEVDLFEMVVILDDPIACVSTDFGDGTAQEQIKKATTSIRLNRMNDRADCILEQVKDAEENGFNDFQWIKIGTKLSLGDVASAEQDLAKVELNNAQDEELKQLTEVKILEQKSIDGTAKASFAPMIQQMTKSDDPYIQKSAFSARMLVSDVAHERSLNRGAKTPSQQAFLQLKLSPNPAGNWLNIETISNEQIKGVTFINHFGQVLKVNSEASQNLDVSDLLPGLYIVQVQTELDNIYSAKFIKK